MVQQLRERREEIARLHRTQMSRAEHLATLGELATGFAHEVRNPLAGILLLNAVQAIDGAGAIRVEISLLKGDAAIVVIDTGRGIVPEHLPNIFLTSSFPSIQPKETARAWDSRWPAGLPTDITAALR